MRRAIVVAVALLTCACGKKEESQQAAPPSTTASGSAPSASKEAIPSQAKAAPLKLSGTYESKQAEVRTPSDAPPFVHPEAKEGVGAGDIELALPSEGSGEVQGSAKGALGALTITGWLDENRLTGTVYPGEGGDPAMWGTLDATVEGAGASRTVKGVLRVSGRDGRVVREASFKLEKKS